MSWVWEVFSPNIDDFDKKNFTTKMDSKIGLREKSPIFA
jgi:hypothetical protein